MSYGALNSPAPGKDLFCGCFQYLRMVGSFLEVCSKVPRSSRERPGLGYRRLYIQAKICHFGGRFLTSLKLRFVVCMIKINLDW